ncbi:MAG: D-alanyl-D-alanine carboxypeptidase/D-alanyl-D-alanine-endopeptidase [Phycisphaerae bacterium]|nr:D-alanyl-D-alanine carboxypeptidase/D-alanyl-D-alanine-endopeptidase [Phycisphaerae bacterium]
MRRAAYCLLAIAAVAAAVGGAPAQGDPAALSQRVAAAVEEFRKTGSPTVGISAVDLRSGQTLLDINAATPLIPASNQKLLTTAFALARLGRDFRFTTTVYSLGDDILVIGDGDPTLGDPVLAAAAGKSIYDELDRWAEAIRRTCGATIRDLVLCVSWPEGSGRQEDWPRSQWQRWYAAPPASLNFNDNCLDITFTVAAGQATTHVQPASRFIKIVSQVQVARKHGWSASTSEDDSVLTLTGTVARGSEEPVSVAVDNPPLLLGRVLAERLARVGVTLSGTIRTAPTASVDPAQARQIAQTTTPLAVVLARSNKRSMNLAAECLLLRAGDGTWKGSAALMARGLQEISGLDTTGLVVRDGGGLSRGNRVSAATIVGLLSAVLRRSEGKLLVDSLPISGTDGSMQHRLAEAAYRGSVLGKTGYIAGVSALSGYVLDEDGRPAIAFSILVNEAPSAAKAKTFQDALCRLLVDYLRASSARPATP